jgi:glutathione synthase/RimK-type ligase-like ATP-grasp enzyme
VEPGVPGSSPGGGTILDRATAGLNFKSSHARYAAHSAQALGFEFIAHDSDGYLFEIRDGARRAFFSCAAGSPYALNPAHSYSIARDKAFTQNVLDEAGLPTIPSRLFFTSSEHAALRGPGREPADALAFAAKAAFPLFVKPIDGARGGFAEIVCDAAQFERYLARVNAKHYAILVQPVIEAAEGRVFVLKGKALFWYRKRAPTLMGDGVSTLAALARSQVETLSARDQSGASYCAGDIPPAGAELRISGAVNRSVGGSASPPEESVPAHLAELALACASALRLELAAVDVFERADGPVVIEVNANPAIHTLEDHGRWDLIEKIWRGNFDAALR